MNKYQEALDTLISKTSIMNDTCASLGNCIKDGKCRIGQYKCIECDDYKMSMTLQKLVDKTIPKKAIIRSDYDGYVYECPICHEEFRPDYFLNHIQWQGCPYCGQKLDWSEE